MKEFFQGLARNIANFLGTPYAFILALLFIATWAISGPIFKFSDVWQLVVNTATNVITFIIVFLIQNTQKRDTGAIQLKLDEIIRSLQRLTIK